MKKDKIYLELHINETKRKIDRFIDDYNKRIKEEQPEKYKSKKIWATYRDTMLVIVNMYYKHLINIKNMQADEWIPFRINNVALARKRKFDIQKDKRGQHICGTSARHIKKLQEFGFITGKIFRGTNSSYELELNQVLLVVNNDVNLSKSMLISVENLKKSSEINDNYKKIINRLTPCFSEISQNNFYASCYDIENFLTKVFFINNNNIHNEEKIVKNNDFFNISTNANAFEQKPMPEHTKQKPINNQKKNEFNKILGLYVFLAWKFAAAAIWNNRIFSKNEIIIAKKLITAWFLKQHDNKDRINFERVFKEFSMRIQITKQSLERNPANNFQLPSVYFDPGSRWSFEKTKLWYKINQKKSENNNEFYKNQQLVVKLYRDFMKNQTTYLSSCQMLGKKHDKSHLELYNRCVINPDEFTKEIFQQYAVDKCA